MIGHFDSSGKQEVVAAGIDSALQKTGVSIFKDGKYEIYLVKPASKFRGAERLLDLRNQVMSLIVKANPALVALEGYSYDSVGRWFELGEIGGVLKVELMLQGVPMVIVPPASLKKFMTNSGSASKAKMIATVCRHCGIDTENDDLADATAAARLAYVMLTGDSTRRCELETVKKLRETNDKKPKKMFKKFWVAM